MIYNPLSGDGKSEEKAKLLPLVLDTDLAFYDMTRITNYAAFFSGMDKDDCLVIVGGDGTLNRFINDTDGMELPREILYLSSGSGNDFAREINANETPVVITQYLKNLPSVEVNGKRYRFINGVGFGIDGYCCQVGDELKKTPGKKVNYTAIAIKGLMFSFAPRNAKVTVDGKVYTYKNVWLAPTMFGGYYGGGMIPTPGQNRTETKDSLSTLILHTPISLHVLMMFPSIFKGELLKYKKNAVVHSGKEITVEFDHPAPIQIDGETIIGVTSYTAKAYSMEEEFVNY